MNAYAKALPKTASRIAIVGTAAIAIWFLLAVASIALDPMVVANDAASAQGATRAEVEILKRGAAPRRAVREVPPAGVARDSVRQPA